MTRLSLRSRMVVTAVAAAGLALAVILWLAGPRLAKQAKDGAYATLTAEARLIARVAETQLAEASGSQALDAVIDAAASEVNARVTVIARDGRVLAESRLSGEELAYVENHASRPEVQAALGGDVGRSERRSSTVGADLLYAAVPIHQDGAVVGVARLSRGQEVIEQQSRELWRAAANALVLAVLATGALAVALSASFGRSLRAIMRTAREFADGNLNARMPAARRDELGELARIINRSADRLQGQLAELARDRSRTEAILSAMEDGVLAVDHRGAVVVANPSLSRALELSSPIGRHYTEAIRHPTVGSLIEQTRQGAQRCQAEMAPVHANRTYTVTAVPFPGEVGAPDGVVLTFTDTTQQRRLEQVRRDFVANASHELRTPLTSIRGYVEALEDGAVEDPDTAPSFLGKIRTHAERMSALVADLLELGRLESGVLAPSWQPSRPGAVADDVVASFAGLAAWRHITLERVDLGAPEVVTDPEWLRRLVENIVDNAIKYTPAGGRVTVVTAFAEEGRALVEVADDGPGIAPEHVARIFERFYRVDKSRSREVGGTGLGLSIVKHLADSLGIAVGVDSALGRGTRFSVSIPREPGPIPASASGAHGRAGAQA